MKKMVTPGSIEVEATNDGRVCMVFKKKKKIDYFAIISPAEAFKIAGNLIQEAGVTKGWIK